MDENKKEPVIGGVTNSVLDNSSVVDDINQEQVAEPIEKPNAAKLLFNKNNRLLLFSLIGISVIGLASILYAFASIEQEANKKPPVIQKNDGELPIGEQTEARAKEIDLYNQKKSNGVVQPIALENVSNKSTQDLDFDVETKEPDIDEISGCSLSDTACMRIKKRISPDECAPKDAVCLAVLESRKEKDSAHEKVELSEHDKYLLRLKDPEYSKQIAELIKKTADSKKEMFVENGAIIDYPEPVVEPEKNKETSSDIEGGILSKATEDIIKLMDSGDRLMGAAEIALNSKIEGEASFSVFGGEFVETRMLGQVKRQDEYMRVELHTWVLPDRRECSIQAIALDKKTTYAAIASRVDHHTLYRYGWWGLGTVLSAVGKAAEMNSDTDVVIVDGTVIQSTESNSKREVRMAVGNLGQEIGRVMQKRIDTPPTVYVDINETVGIFFMKPVTTADCKFGGSSNERISTEASSQKQ